MAFRSFVAPTNLAEMLSFRLMHGYNKKEETVKLRTFVVLRQWLCNYYEIDFGDDQVKQPILDAIESIKEKRLELTLADQQILNKLKKYANREELASEELSRDPLRGMYLVGNSSVSSSSESTGKASWFKTLGKRISRVMMRGNIEKEVLPGDESSAMSPSIDTGQLSWFDGNISLGHPWTKCDDLAMKYEKHSCLAMEYTGIMAEHLCLIESKWFHSVSWTELLSYPRCAQSIDSCIEHFNQMCQWMISEILRAPSHNEQAVIIQKLIRITLKCLGHSNFNSVMQIMLALQNPSVEGLQQAWRRLNEYERSLYEDLVAFVSPLRNFRNIRKAMELQEVACTPCVPFTGLYLSDLSSNRERPGNCDVGSNLVPWFRHQTAARIIKQFKAFQSADRLFSFTLRPELYRYLQNCCQQIQEDQPS